jgi:hypothetical protein
LNEGTKKVISENGVITYPPNNHPDAIRMKRFERHGNLVNISFDQPMRMNKCFVRGLYKIAFELLCLKKGTEYVLAPRFDSIRDYVRYGKGSRCFVFDSTPTNIREKPTLELHQITGTQDWGAEIGVFFVDLTPDNSFFKNADEAKLKEEHLVRRWDIEVRQ